MSRADFERIFSAITTFFGVLLVVAFAIGVSSGDALKGPDAFVLRWTVLSLAAAFSALVAWLRWRMLLRRELSSPAAAIAAAGKQAIVFRQHFPPRPESSTLSFFGGAPIVPSGFQWPRSAGKVGPSKPFSFLMQIDCADVPAPARLGMLPDRGILYFFLDLTWGEPNAFRVLYEEGGVKNWTAIEPPDDLDYAYGDQAAHVWQWTQSAEDAPRLLPKWTFQPVALEIPPHAANADEQEEDAPVLWPGDKAMAEALRAAQGDEVVSNWFSVKDFIAADGAMIRPFANYPHDWRAVQICSGLLLHQLRRSYSLTGTLKRRGLSDAEGDALVTRITGEARSWFDRAASQSPFAGVSRAESDEFWSWLADKSWLVRFVMTEALNLSIEASLADSREAAARIPADVARRVHDRHALASRSEHGLFTTTPNRMLAPPVDVQGNQWDRARTHLLLLELSSNDGLGHHFGEGVYQFWITSDDLKARRFDKVELTADAY